MNIKSITQELGLKSRHKKCPIKAAGLKEINYKDVELLKEFITEKGKIIPKRISGVCARNQRKLADAIKRARNLALISFSEGYSGFEDKPGQSIYTISTHADITTNGDMDVEELDDDLDVDQIEEAEFDEDVDENSKPEDDDTAITNQEVK